jgi:pyridinium-3,5-biscarboxylic acid mononucleotide synthase
MMDPRTLEQLASRLLDGRISLGDFLQQAGAPRIADIGEAQVDIDRHRRCGFPEVVFGEGKTVETMQKIFEALLDHGMEVLATRVSAEKAAALFKHFPNARYNEIGRTLRIGETHENRDGVERGRVTIVTAGTSDLPAAEEARETALWTGADVQMVADVGVAGPHRLAAKPPVLQRADAVVVVAGMEGALPSVVGGHVACPVIAVPTSVGYGASFGGVAALLGMLNSCAANVAVVNIDAGFKGGYVAGMIARNKNRKNHGDTENTENQNIQ